MNWVAKIILTILGLLVCAVFILLGIHFANDLFHFWPVHIDSIKPCDKFEVYRDLLIILLATLGVAGYFVYKETRDRLEKEMKKSIEEHRDVVYGSLYHHLSYIHWREYENLDPASARHEELCDLAITEAEDAIRLFENLHDRKYENRISYFRMTLAYNLAVRQRQEDKAEALRLAKENWETAIKFNPSGEYNVRESLIWVILKHSDDSDEKQDAQKGIQDLMKWTRAPKEWKKKMAEKYAKNFGISLSLPS